MFGRTFLIGPHYHVIVVPRCRGKGSYQVGQRRPVVEAPIQAFVLGCDVLLPSVADQVVQLMELAGFGDDFPDRLVILGESLI